jgi:hypothetical protein
MTTIPLSAALALLKHAHDIVVAEEPTTTSFTFDASLEDFMGLTTEDDINVFEYVFTKADNAEVEIDGELMTLIDSSSGVPVPVEFRLMVPLRLEPPPIPPKILAALLHVRKHCPTVDRVVFWADTRWCYMDDRHHIPTFPDTIDTGILEEAVYDLVDLPAAYQLPEEEAE